MFPHLVEAILHLLAAVELLAVEHHQGKLLVKVVHIHSCTYSYTEFLCLFLYTDCHERVTRRLAEKGTPPQTGTLLLPNLSPLACSWPKPSRRSQAS